MKATIRDVAELAGTSMASVSAVLNGNGRHNIRVGQATRQRIRAAAAQLRYTPNPVAQSLVTGKTGVVGLVFPYSSAFMDHNPFCTQVMSGVIEEVVRDRFNLMLYTATGDDWNAADEEALVDARVDGLILALPQPESSVVAHCRRERFPCVSLVYEAYADDICAVNVDEFAGGRLATEHLTHLGHRRIAHLMGRPGVVSTEGRRRGYLAALEAAGLPADPALLIPADYVAQRGYEGMQRLLDLPPSQRPTAVFAANDPCAEGAMRAIRERGLRVPEDVAVVGFDDTWFATMTQPQLTSVHMPIYEMGMLATRMLIQLMEGRDVAERQPVLPVSLNVRQSSGDRVCALISPKEKES